MASILMLMVAFDLSALVRYITRFTEESFALLIALIFIVESFKKLFHILDHHAVDLHPMSHRYIDRSCLCNTTSPNDTYSANRSTWFKVEHYEDEEDCEDIHGKLTGPGCHLVHYTADVFFLCCLMFIFTFFLAYTLKNMRASRFFTTRVITHYTHYIINML